MPRPGPTTKRSPRDAVVIVPKRGEPWELPELDHERRAEAISNLGACIERAGLPHIGPDGWSAASFWWGEVFDNHADPTWVALFAFGATPDQLADMSTEFGLAFQRTLAGLKIKHMRRVGKVKEANYLAALSEHGQSDRKLFLQAHAAEYVPTTKTKVTIDDLRAVVEEASDDELAILAGTDTGTGEG